MLLHFYSEIFNAKKTLTKWNSIVILNLESCPSVQMLAPSNLIEISYHFWIAFDVQFFFPIGKRSDDIFGRFAFNAIINDDLRTFLFLLWLHFGIIKANITVMDSAFDERHCKLLISGAPFSYGILLKNNSYQQKCWIEILFLLLNFHA